jgi:hypothetical protein
MTDVNSRMTEANSRSLHFASHSLRECEASVGMTKLEIIGIFLKRSRD